MVCLALKLKVSEEHESFTWEMGGNCTRSGGQGGKMFAALKVFFEVPGRGKREAFFLFIPCLHPAKCFPLAFSL